MRLITSVGGDADLALDALREIASRTSGVRAPSIRRREPYQKAGPDGEAVVVLIPGDRDCVIRLYDSLRQIAASGWTDINDVERDTVWNYDRSAEPFLSRVVWAEMAAIDTDGDFVPL